MKNQQSMSSSSPWIRLEMDVWENFLEKRNLRKFNGNTIIYQQDQPAKTLYIVHTGRVRITSYLSNGNEKQLYIVEEGCCFGESDCFLGGHFSSSAVTIVKSEIYTIPFCEFEEEAQKNWLLMRNMTAIICRKNKVLTRQALDQSFGQSCQRVVNVLLNLGREYGIAVPEGLKISIRFTHQDVANIANASRVTVNKIFQDLAEQNIICRQDGRYILCNEEALAEIVREN